ncbi:Muscarinic acetylcholine receptor M4 [Merluccius polli]|uniref:Muscarinic acetylcholine receptor n=1 Tax=Merluccius polli TaxID=89951 RepID=A0AA47N3U2_MERPO|nr:Muscarinic acetylcholine receptor M4 [Merluccius polli]KAK0155733.1 Muscarinic acetylcholine receptor M4 [Merluccius polli]
MGLTPENDTASTLPCSCMNSSCPCSYSITQTALIVTVTSSLSLLTVLGNLLVMLSIGVNRHLRTANNYFLFSLAVADLFIGLVSMNLYALYLVKGHWPLGALLCDLWLLLDYVVSNASVMNLLVISLDRYFCVTRPLSYPARRTDGMAGLMIAAAWLLSLLLWAPPILWWQMFPAKRQIPEGQCYVQLLASPPLTLGTTVVSFYLPAVVMVGLYGRIAAASRSRLHRRRSVRTSAAAPPQNRRFLESRSLASSESETKTVSDCLTQTDSGRASKPPENGKSSSPQGNPKEATEMKRLSSEPKPAAIQTRIRAFSRTYSMLTRWQERRRRRVLTRERRVTHTVLAILTAFIVTWTPYNIMAVVGTFCRVCVPNTLWAAGYWMCYINSAINPGFYALFNVTFRKTFLRLLQCSRRKT